MTDQLHAEAATDSVASWRRFVGGEHRDTRGETFEVRNPATAEVIARVADAGANEVDEAVAVAALAQPGWAALPPRRRAPFLRQAADVLRAHADELGALESLENGKTRRDARAFDVNYAIATFDLFAGLVETLHGELLDQGPIEAHVRPEPYGVIGAILPFNWPPVHFAAKVAPAVAAGNAIIVKPGEQAPLTVLRMTELVGSVFPPGVINAVPGMAAGVALAAHPGIGRLTFTGAPDTGRKVLAAAAANLTPATMELGGKNALLVFPDTDLELAIAAALEGIYFNQGEACTATSRVLVHRDVYDVFAARLADATRRIRVGDGADDSTDVGPMVDPKQRQRVLDYISIGQGEGARVLTQAPVPDDPRLSDGYWVPPTLFTDVTASMRIAQEEIFGPVATLIRFEDEDEAIEIANGTEFGLTAAVFTGDHERARRISRRLAAGMVFVNNYFRASLLGSPFGGIKASGFGREGAAETLREFVRSKNVRWPSGEGEVPIWGPAARLASESSPTSISEEGPHA